MMEHQDFLVELGTEELPPKSLASLSQAFADSIVRQVKEAGLRFDSEKVFATPRRMAVILSGLSTTQPDRIVERKGPSLKAAYKNGEPTKAATGFASSCGVTVEELETLETEKGEWLVFRMKQQGQTAAKLLPEIVRTALDELPVSKRMRWGAKRDSFVRPVHWLVMLQGNQVIRARIFDLESDRLTFGHRVHCPNPLSIDSPECYESLMRDRGYVIVSFEKRREMISKSVVDAARSAGGHAMIDEPLLDEVTALVEWPVALTGKFDAEFLKVPSEALVSSMQSHQKYFPVTDEQGALLPCFVCIANLESSDMSQVIAGNERVIRPRLADARFFYETDLKSSLEEKREKLKTIVFQQQLGTLFDRTERIARLAGIIIQNLSEDGDLQALAERAGVLSRSDLVSEMVLEFPELQGIMGRYYGMADQEHEEVCKALQEQYMPRFSGDGLPSTIVGCAVALADRMDVLAGIFGAGMLPSGNRDPFALRRAVLGVLRIIIEKQLKLDFRELVQHAANGYADQNIVLKNENLEENLDDFMLDRLRQWSFDKGMPAEVFLAVRDVHPDNPYDFYRRMQAVNLFRGLPEASTLAQANKRVANILKKRESLDAGTVVKESLFTEEAEKQLSFALTENRTRVAPLLAKQDYQAVLNTLAALKQPVDNFFDQVMVNVEDEALRNNRHALLHQLRQLFLQVADISCLQSG